MIALWYVRAVVDFHIFGSLNTGELSGTFPEKIYKSKSCWVEHSSSEIGGNTSKQNNIAIERPDHSFRHYTS